MAGPEHLWNHWGGAGSSDRMALDLQQRQTQHGNRRHHARSETLRTRYPRTVIWCTASRPKIFT